MSKSILSEVDASIICLVLFVVMLLTIAFGNKMRKKFWGAQEGETRGGVNSLLAALFGLWSFVIAFTFNQSGSRFENVRALIVDEANILRNTIIKADLFPDSIRDAYRADLRTYLEQRITYYNTSQDKIEFQKNREALTNTSKTLWARTAAISKTNNMSGPVGSMIISLTGLFDIGIKREALLKFGIPIPIAYMLIFLMLSISFVGGFTTPVILRKEWIVITVFAFLASTVLYITIDLSRPMEGLIKPDTGQQTIINLRELLL